MTTTTPTDANQLPDDDDEPRIVWRRTTDGTIITDPAEIAELTAQLQHRLDNHYTPTT